MRRPADDGADTAVGANGTGRRARATAVAILKLYTTILNVAIPTICLELRTDVASHRASRATR
jgi:hypothetical protein